MAKKTINKKPISKAAPKKVVAKKAAAPAKKQVKSAKPAAKTVVSKKKVVKVAPKAKVVAKSNTKVTKPVAKQVAKPIAKKVAAKAVSKKTVKPAKVAAKPAKAVVAKPVKAEKPAKVEKIKVEKPAKVAKVKPEKPVKVPKKVLLPTPETFAEVIEKPTKIPAKYTKVEMEFPIHASRYFLYNMFSTASGLSEWFADNVNIRGNFFTFIWDGSEQTAELKAYREGSYVRFRWLDSPEIYFEFRIETDDLTGDVALIVTDFAEDLSSEQSTRLLWNSQIENLMRVIGA